jgi:hypothetical protein
MITKYNNTFRHFLMEYHLPEDLSFSVDFPQEIKDILKDQILINNRGITLSSTGELGELSKQFQNYSELEDFENHFHVDQLINPPDNRDVFMLGVKALISLADKFHNQKVKGVRFWYSFQTPELGELWAKDRKLHEDSDEYLLYDRLSFYKRRRGENITGFRKNEKSYWARMVIDI